MTSASTQVNGVSPPVALDAAPVNNSSSSSMQKNRTPVATIDSEKGAPPAQVPVDRSQRRGFLPQLTLVPELHDPRTYSGGTKWLLTSLVAVAGAMSSTGSSIFYPALAEMSVELHTTSTITNMSLAFYMLAMAFTPMWWSYFSEKLGRRNVYLLSFALFVVFSAISAVSVNVAMLIVFRTLSGGAAAAVQAVGAGTVADLWEPKMRGKAMGIFYIGPLCGPGLAPVIGGALAQNLGWRSTLWFLTIFGGVVLLSVLFLLPETLSRANMESNKDSKEMGTAMYVFKGIVDPFKALSLLRHPPVFIAVYCAVFAFASLFVVNIGIQANFGDAPYRFDELKVGLLYLAPTLGYALSSQLSGRWIDHIMAREARKAGRFDESGKPIYLPEDRMKENIWIATFIYPSALIWYGWTADRGIFWFVPCLASFFFGIGSMMVFGCVTTMLTEFTPKRSSTGVAINNFIRNILSAIAAVVTQPMLDGLGTGWTFTMVGLWALVTSVLAILAMKRWGPQWRVSMDKALNTKE